MLTNFPGDITDFVSELVRRLLESQVESLKQAVNKLLAENGYPFEDLRFIYEENWVVIVYEEKRLLKFKPLVVHEFPPINDFQRFPIWQLTWQVMADDGVITSDLELKKPPST